MNKNNHRWQLGDKVKKKANSSWRGVVCGFYNTAATPNGYSVVSLYEPGSVQVWPEAALEDWDGVMGEDELRAEITRLTEALRAAEEREGGPPFRKAIEDAIGYVQGQIGCSYWETSQEDWDFMHELEDLLGVPRTDKKSFYY